MRPAPPGSDTMEDPQTMVSVENAAKVRVEGVSRCRGSLLSDYTAISPTLIIPVPCGALTSMGVPTALTTVPKQNRREN